MEKQGKERKATVLTAPHTACPGLRTDPVDQCHFLKEPRVGTATQ